MDMGRLSVQVGRGPSGRRRAEARETPGLRSWGIRLSLASKKSHLAEAASARTANRHRWPGISMPRWTSDPSLRN